MQIWDWRKSQNYVLDRALAASVLWDVARQKEVLHKDLAREIGRSPYTIQSTLSGRSSLTWDRAFWLVDILQMSRLVFIDKVEMLEGRLDLELGGLTVLREMPDVPPERGERQVMAYHIQARLRGQGWEEIYGPEVVTPGMVWRARVEKFGTRRAAAAAFKVTQQTVSNWERVYLPKKRWKEARWVYGDKL